MEVRRLQHRILQMPALTFDLPPEVFTALRRSPPEFVAEMRIAAIYWYSRGEVSQSRAADIAGMTRLAFINELSRRKVDAFAVDLEDLAREVDRG
jgi:predicted HTH domain antitoxin